LKRYALIATAQVPSNEAVPEVQTAGSHSEARLAAWRHTNTHTSLKEGELAISPEMAVGDVFRRFSTTLHSVWGYVSLTGIAAAVPLGFHPL
jgi:hypothetical protein